MTAGVLTLARQRGLALPRPLHPGAWWVWALGLAVAASRTTNPLLLGLIVAVAGFVVSARRTDTPWSRSYAAYLKLGLLVIVIRVVFAILFGAPIPGTLLVTLPEVSLPDWALGVRIGGPVTLETVAAAAYEGLRLATLLACVGAANSLANPKRALRILPGALYELGVAVVIAMSFSPQLLSSVGRVREARRLRGQARGGVAPVRWVRGIRRTAMPVLEDALERSVELAAAMDSRGYGRRAGVPVRTRRLTATLVIGGLVGVCAGLYGLTDTGALGSLPVPLLAAGLAMATVGLVLGGRRTTRSRYRPDPWAAPEWLVALSGLAAAVGVAGAAVLGEPTLAGLTVPWTVPVLPLLPAAAVLVAATPAWTAPPAPTATAPTGARS
ncbi:MAG TPA: energy-coupling factor transporter transmembrane component T [Actinomycetes bacterium]|nr:energy-coupling factor transporter transmembrane component T [Actinomycetes bacterium]